MKSVDIIVIFTALTVLTTLFLIGLYTQEQKAYPEENVADIVFSSFWLSLLSIFFIIFLVICLIEISMTFTFNVDFSTRIDKLEETRHNLEIYSYYFHKDSSNKTVEMILEEVNKYNEQVKGLQIDVEFFSASQDKKDELAQFPESVEYIFANNEIIFHYSNEKE